MDTEKVTVTYTSTHWNQGATIQSVLDWVQDEEGEGEKLGCQHHLADDRQKIDRDFSTLWLEKPPSILSTTCTTTDLEFTLNDY